MDCFSDAQFLLTLGIQKLKILSTIQTTIKIANNKRLLFKQWSRSGTSSSQYSFLYRGGLGSVGVYLLLTTPVHNKIGTAPFIMYGPGLLITLNRNSTLPKPPMEKRQFLSFDQTDPCNLNTGLVQYSDLHCTFWENIRRRLESIDVELFHLIHHFRTMFGNQDNIKHYPS